MDETMIEKEAAYGRLVLKLIGDFMEAESFVGEWGTPSETAVSFTTHEGRTWRLALTPGEDD